MYLWNLRLSAALWKPLALVEVGVRNAMDRWMEKRHRRLGGDGVWRGHPGLHRLDRRMGEDLKKARIRAQRTASAAPTIAAGRVIAELSFGFWRVLFSQKHLRSDLIGAFYAAPSRDHRPIAANLARVDEVRNRIAHHDPVWDHHPERAHRAILELADGLGPQFGRWTARCSAFTAVLADRPSRATPLPDDGPRVD